MLILITFNKELFRVLYITFQEVIEQKQNIAERFDGMRSIETDVMIIWNIATFNLILRNKVQKDISNVQFI